MALAYLKLSPEEAVEILEQQITQGYQLKDKLHREYSSKSGDQINGELITQWRNESKIWADETISTLLNIYMTPRQAYNFRDAKTDGLMRVGINIDFEGIIKTLQSRIDVLNSYIDFIFQHANIQIVAGRDVNLQVGENAKMEVKNEG